MVQEEDDDEEDDFEPSDYMSKLQDIMAHVKPATPSPGPTPGGVLPCIYCIIIPESSKVKNKTIKLSN